MGGAGRGPDGGMSEGGLYLVWFVGVKHEDQSHRKEIRSV